MQHLAFIMDGNRRWAKKEKLKVAMYGHRKGVGAVEASIEFCLKKGIKYLSLFTFSLENFQRGKTEQTYIFKLLVEVLKKNVANLIDQGVRICFIGDRNYFPEDAKNAIKEVEEETKHLNKLQLNMLFCYGARQELLYAIKKLSKKVEAGTLQADEITEDLLRREFWTAGIPDPDLIIRTGGRTRLSNFLLFQAAYSELMFIDYYWPEINEERLEQFIGKFAEIQRNFGV